MRSFKQHLLEGHKPETRKAELSKIDTKTLASWWQSHNQFTPRNEREIKHRLELGIELSKRKDYGQKVPWLNLKDVLKHGWDE